MPEPWHRFFEQPFEGGVRIYHQRCAVIRETPKGVWIYDPRDPGAERFVLRNARKRFACPTEAEALQSFIERKRRQLGIYRTRAKLAEQAIELAKQGRVENNIWDAFVPWAKEA